MPARHFSQPPTLLGTSFIASSYFANANLRLYQCKNYDAVRQWAEKLQAPPPNTLPPDYLKKPDPRYTLPETP